MIVIIDSNIVVNSYKIFEYSGFQRFCKHFPEKNITVAFSKVSTSEILANYRAKLYEEALNHDKQVGALNKLIKKELKLLDTNFLKKEVENYKKSFNESLNKTGIKTFEIPKVTHEDIIEYASLKKKPFDSKDNGYKDYLIWCTVVEQLKKGKRPVVLISNDNDFGDGDGELHQDLKEDLKSKSIELSRFILCKSINEFNEKFLKDVYDLVEIKEFFASLKEVHNFFYNNHDKIEHAISMENPAHHDIDLDFRVEDPTFFSVELYDDFKIKSIDQIGNKSFVIEFSVSGSSDIEIIIPKSDVYSLDDDFDIGDERNDWYQEAYVNRDIYVEGNFIIKKTIDDIIRIEVHISSGIKGA